MKSPNESILSSLLEQQNVVLAKIATCKNAGWEVPENLIERQAELNVALDVHKRMMIEDAIREARK